MKGLAVVLQMAAHTIFSAGIVYFQFKVIAVPCRKILRDFLVAIEAFKCRRAGSEGMARSALRGAAEGRVGFRKRARGNLRASGERNEQTGSEEQERKEESPLEEFAQRSSVDVTRRAFAHAVLRIFDRKQLRERVA